ncbi:hypothetical protein RhiirA4_471196 [Rhizophagus irregularis]|uniref:Uncharacterized protein n=1 Tax=Rhizophagus irregularis TaxID=588596 RepID=A0A2I1H2P0_9GLOM|nr:hypothetical protein RhiirA4_471196 [Rhizophagus irregularis]
MVFDDILAEIHYYVGKLTGNEKIIHSDYLVLFKLEKSTEVGIQLADIQDYKKFLVNYKKLLNKKKYSNCSFFEKEKKAEMKDFNEKMENENIKLHKNKNAIPKLDNFSQFCNKKDRTLLTYNKGHRRKLAFSPLLIVFTLLCS